jgi:hypothetical protein
LIEAQAWLTGVRNPSGFSAVVMDQNQIQLNWSLNDAANSVVVAFAEENQFGVPLEDSTYFVGDTLPGGGILLYAGSDTTFLHNGLTSASRYYYKIWSVSDTLSYSSGRTVSAITDCAVYNLPFGEGFETDPSVPICWSQENVNGPAWMVGSGNGSNNPPNAYSGNSNIYFRSDGLFNNGLTTRLVTPQLDMSGIDTAVLTFYYANPERTFLFLNWQDELKIKYKAAIDDNWTVLQSFNSNVTNWTQVSVNLPELSGTYYIAFEGISNSGYGISIDEIEINGSQIAGYIIMAGVEGNGNINPYGEVFVLPGEFRQFDVEADNGHHISALLVDDEEVVEAADETQFSFTFDSIDSAHTITAYFLPNAYEVNVSIVPQNSGEVTINGLMFYGESIELIAESFGNDFVFSHWVSNDDTISDANPFSFELLADTLIEAHFKLLTSVRDNDSPRMLVYPNPTKGSVNMELPKSAQVRIFDLQGRLQYEANLTSGKHLLNLQGLKPAAYLIKLQFEDEVITRRILVY